MPNKPGRAISRTGYMFEAGRSGLEYFRKRVRLLIHVLRLSRGSQVDTASIPHKPRPELLLSDPPLRVTEDLSRHDSTIQARSDLSIRNPMMSAFEIIEILRNPGVPDITNFLKCPDNDPISLGSSGMLYHAQSAKGEVAVRTIRIFIALNSANQRLLKAAADELLVWLRLRHDFITPLLGVACFHGQPALVSPWMRFGNLQDFRMKQSFNWLEMCTQVSCAVAYLHDNGLIHGDIKAQNVLVSDDGTAKLTGFGNSVLRELASHYRDGNDFSTLSMRWTAPEVLQGADVKSPEVDVYALGMTILEIATGRIPYGEIDSDRKVMLKVMACAIPSRPQELDSHDQIWTVLTQCWNSDPKARPTARGIYNMLNSVS